ncbi:MAG: Tab2/Atab2 family RNA-binding protein [Pseudanabaenaceae cyanobacterium bins.68]|nr:Tab2/Atab2 family RNA-binding protein [Pseudanabaenaceae cyanobacterium bins.68]
MRAVFWELDFFSRPQLDANQKKIWELLICNSDRSWEYRQICPPDQVNSEWLASQLHAAIATTAPPLKVRFFRATMANMITRGCKAADLIPQASRRLFTLRQWLQECYPEQADPLPLILNPQPILQTPPDALVGDRWLIASLTVTDLSEADQWQIDFGERFPVNLPPTLEIPGVIIYSRRALPLAAWMSGVDPVFLTCERNYLVLDAGADSRWRLAKVDPRLRVKAEEFEQAKPEGVHFLAIQTKAEDQEFAGFWLLKS